MRKVLMIAYAFPPVGGAGVQRVVKFIKYLQQAGWSADAVSVMNPSVPLVDESLMKELPADCIVHRSKTLEPSYSVKASMKNRGIGQHVSYKSRLIGLLKKLANNILLPDAQVLWWPHTFILLSRLLKARQHEVLFVSGPPFSTLFISVFLAKRYSIPVVVDYRDEWSFSRSNWENAVRTFLSRLVDSWMETYVVKHSNAITVASPYYKTSLEQMFPFSLGKIQTITNGYDPADFEGIDFTFRNNNSSSFTIVYTGTIWRATSFSPFMEAIRIIADKDPSVLSRVNLRIIGRIVAEEVNVIDQLKTFINVETLDYLPHEKIFPEIVSADLLLLTLANLPGAGKIIPGKTFEYLAAPIPILAIIPEGVTAEIISEHKNVHFIAPDDPVAIASVLCSLVKEPCERVQREGIEKFSRPYLAKQLVELFEATSFKHLR